MRGSPLTPCEKYPDSHHDVYSKTLFGFWIYILTDFMLFATLFVTYILLRRHTFGGPPEKELFHLHLTLIQTFFLLLSTLTVGLGGVMAHRRWKGGTIALFSLTFLLGSAFMWMELGEFSSLIASGNSWERSAFLSIFFTLVGTHGLHLLFALLWIVVLLIPVCREGLTPVSIKRLTCLKMFWQFLNIIWVFIFAVVYLMGSMHYD